MQMNPRKIKSALIAVTTFVSGLYFFLNFILPQKMGPFQFGKFYEQALDGVRVVGVMAIGLGLINIIRVHGTKLVHTKKGWGNSLTLIVGLLLSLGTGMFDLVHSEGASFRMSQLNALEKFAQKVVDDSDHTVPRRVEALNRAVSLIQDIKAEREKCEGPFASCEKNDLEPKKEEPKQGFRVSADSFDIGAQNAALGFGTLAAALERGETRENLDRELNNLQMQLREFSAQGRVLSSDSKERSPAKKWFTFIEQAFFVPLGTAMFSLLAFYIASAAYRSFRLRSLEASIMMVIAVVVMLGQIPHGPIYVWEGLPAARLWLLQNVSVPAFRAIYFSAAIAGLAMAVRMWLSLEKNPISTDDTQS